MTPRSQPKLAMRPMLPADAPLLAEIFRASIEELTGDDYSEAQQEAWASAADDEEDFGARLAGELTLVATYDGRHRICLARRQQNIDMLYVHPVAAGQGAGAMLCSMRWKTGRCARQQRTDRRGQRHGARLLRKARFQGAAAQYRFACRRMALQYHNEQAACGEGKCRIMSEPPSTFFWLAHASHRHCVIAILIAVALASNYYLW